MGPMNKRIFSGFAVFSLILSLAASMSLSQPALAMKPISGGVSEEAYGLTDDINAADALIQNSPDDPEAHFLAAVAYSRTPYVEKALSELEKSKKLAKKSKEGFALFDRKIKEYEGMQQKDPDNTLVLYRLGFGYYIRGYAVTHHYMKDTQDPSPYFDKAEATFKHLLTLNPNDYMSMNYLGYLLAERDPDKNYDEAVGLWNRSLKLSEENPGAYMLLGQAAMKKGNLRQMVEYSTKAFQARNAWLESHNIDPATVKVEL